MVILSKKKLGGNSNSLNYIKNGIFVKVYPNQIHEELIKHQKIFEISLKNGFLFPKIISFCTSESRIDFELIKNASSLRDLYFENNKKSNKQNILNLFFQSGKALACIHKELKYEKKRDWNSKNFSCKLKKHEDSLQIPHAILHGDYTASNILVTASEEIVIIDPSPNFHSTFSPFEYAPIYVDIGNFLSGIEGLFPYKKFFIIKKEYIKLCKSSFIKGYESEYGEKLNFRLIKTYTKYCAKNYLEKKNNLIIYYIKYALFLLRSCF